MTESAVIKVHDMPTFLSHVGSGLTVIDFSATWCGPCRRISPVYEKLASEYTKLIPELKFLKIDVDEVQEAAQGVSGLPTFQFWIDGHRIDSLTVMGASVEKLNGGIVDLLKGNFTLPDSSANAAANAAAAAAAAAEVEAALEVAVAEADLEIASASAASAAAVTVTEAEADGLPLRKSRGSQGLRESQGLKLKPKSRQSSQQ